MTLAATYPATEALLARWRATIQDSQRTREKLLRAILEAQRRA